ncbi:hypothetical protein [Clostridium sp.]|uniref:hypothetical protein n=1 Tax=Clostridium sp. TaxID=1506 RepID=UPI00290FE8F2|nr:hypothetical protein [Clostridium sp.]MDU7363902.1 hypothetical protein [Clostridium sp.]
MIVEYKSKEQRVDEKMEELREFFSEKDFERWVRISKNAAKGNDRLAISNNFLNLKFKLRKIYKNLDIRYEDKKRAKRALELEYIDKNTKKQYQDYIKQLDDLMENYKIQLNSLGFVLINLYVPMLDKYFNKKEISQLIGGSYEQIKRIDEWKEKKETGTRSIAEAYIIHHGEYRWRKGRSKDFIDCPDWEMPLFWCMSDHMHKAIKENPKLSNEMDKQFEEMFSDCIVDATIDEKGNVIAVEKVIQELSVRELVKDYQGKFINELKKGNIFDSKKYRVKKLENNTYCIVDKDNKEIEKIYKKVC